MLLSILKILFVVYLLICTLLFLLQEKLIFFPEKLSKNYRFPFQQKFQEIPIKAQDNTILHAVLFKADRPKGVIFYLHGNAGSINSWGQVAEIYTKLGYDVFMLDYRGYGKSEGKIKDQQQFYDDVQSAYDQLKAMYVESSIIVLGYSIGTGPATKISAVNHPRLLILQAPYYSLTDLMKHLYPIIPTSILKYKFETYKFIRECDCPVVIFHGDRDEIIYFGSSVKLKQLMKPSDRLVILQHQGHNGMSTNGQYLSELKKVLN